MKKDKAYFKKLESYSATFLQGILANEHINLGNPEQNVDYALNHAKGLIQEIDRIKSYEALPDTKKVIEKLVKQVNRREKIEKIKNNWRSFWKNITKFLKNKACSLRSISYL